MIESPFEAQRRKLHELKAKQAAGEAPVPDQHISPKAQARRNAEAASRFQDRAEVEAVVHHPAFASKSTSFKEDGEQRVTSRKKAKKVKTTGD